MPTLPTEEKIREIAYALWLEEGQPDGRAEIHWLKASELVNAEAPPVVKKAGAPKKAAAVAKKPAPRKRS
ncbi:DUF2934 domain-containing protein [Aestuariivirga sp.]|uniref:DUF2934 domain-containing protein n=1 Tax=Aestuariivirga sp. TaxID=2650926 RepID=UPI0039E5C79C